MFQEITIEKAMEKMAKGEEILIIRKHQFDGQYTVERFNDIVAITAHGGSLLSDVQGVEAASKEATPMLKMYPEPNHKPDKKSVVVPVQQTETYKGHFDKAGLERLYLTEGKTMKEMAAVYGCSVTKVNNEMKYHGIPARSRGGKNNTKGEKTECGGFDDKRISKLFYEEKRSYNEISQELGIRKDILYAHMTRQGMTYENRDNFDESRRIKEKLGKYCNSTEVEELQQGSEQ